MGFAQRLGKKPTQKEIQIDSIDADLKNGLWNTYLGYVLGAISAYRGYEYATDQDRYFAFMWHEYFKNAIDESPQGYESNLREIRKFFFKAEWYNLYDFLEFNVSDVLLRFIQYDWSSFVLECNRILEREFSGYRFIERKIAPISNEVELTEIKEALSVGNSMFHSTYAGVNFHLSEALSKLSDKKNPDYRNSIKESISAVETLCRKLTGTSTLGEALTTLQAKGIVINSQLKSGFEKIYAYTNNKESGIRHALIDTPNLPSFNEAKFMLVACSAFINFLISQTK